MITFYMCGLFTFFGVIVAILNGIRLASFERKRRAWKPLLLPPALLSTGLFWAVLWSQFTLWSAHWTVSPEFQSFLNQSIQVLAVAAAPGLAVLALALTQKRHHPTPKPYPQT
jgi:hypothetical protein